MENRDVFSVGRVRLDAIDLPGAVRWFEERIVDRQPSTVVFCTASTIVEAQDSRELREALGTASLVTTDGMPLVWLGKRLVGQQVDRVYGPDFLTGFLKAQKRPLRHFFYGGSPEVTEQLVARLTDRYPLMEVAGSLAPNIVDPTEIRYSDVEVINSSRPDVVWVGLGHPKQEIWMHHHRDVIEAPILAGVGAAFDYLSGAKREAPAWMKERGLQWLHRFVSEPRRLLRRYLVGNSRFAMIVLRDLVKTAGPR